MTYARGAAGKTMRYEQLCDVARCERRVVLRNVGRIDPRSLNDYVATGGYSGLRRALTLGPEGVIAEVRPTGLRGDGGVGHHTAERWQACRAAEGTEKYALCSAVDADPAARTARLLMGGDPHSVLEGLLIGAFAVGAAQAFVCLDAAHQEGITVVQAALAQMRERGLLGEDILGAGFSCEIVVKEVDVSLVTGEETALLRALECRLPLPYLIVEPLSAARLHGRPTPVDSAETLATVSAIFGRNAAAPPAAAGGAAPGTKVVTVTGAVSRGRTVEVPLGTTMAALLEMAEGRQVCEIGIKAVQFGGPTGAFFAGAALDTPITYEDLAAAGSVMGSATMRVFGGDDCAVEMARDAMAYLRDESCGKCPACREGTHQMAEILDDLSAGRSTPDDLELLLELSEAVKAGSICGLGTAACAPFLSVLGLFRNDFQAHLSGHRPARCGG